MLLENIIWKTFLRPFGNVTKTLCATWDVPGTEQKYLGIVSLEQKYTDMINIQQRSTRVWG